MFGGRVFRFSKVQRFQLVSYPDECWHCTACVAYLPGGRRDKDPDTTSHDVVIQVTLIELVINTKCKQVILTLSNSKKYLEEEK